MTRAGRCCSRPAWPGAALSAFSGKRTLGAQEPAGRADEEGAAAQQVGGEAANGRLAELCGIFVGRQSRHELARWLCCSLLAYHPGYTRRSRLARGPGGLQQNAN